MMQENRKRKQELASAVKEYLCQAEMHPISEAIEMVMKKGDYVFVFGLSSFHEGDGQKSGFFLVPIEAEIKLMERIDCLFDTLVGTATVRSSLQSAIHIIAKKTELIFPFESDEQEQQYHDKIYELLNFHFERQYDAIVPLFQLECANGVEFPLANTVLYSGGSRSQLATIANKDDNHFRDDDRQQIEFCSYLKFRVTGDNHSRLEQVGYEVERALQVLRFIYPWFEKDGRPYNPSHGVSMWKHSNRTIVYDRTSPTNTSTSWHAEIPNGIFGARRISDEFLSDATKYLSLDEINYHFRNQDRNPISRRFCRAFKYYDVASQISDADVALANFVISVDILLPSGNAEELTSYLISLIENGELYEGTMKLNETDPESTEWPERVRLTVSDYKEYYIIRDKVVHGNTMGSIVSDLQVKKARQIAKNAIRAFAKLSRAFNWQSDNEAKNWFKNPCKPPEMKSP